MSNSPLQRLKISRNATGSERIASAISGSCSSISGNISSKSSGLDANSSSQLLSRSREREPTSCNICRNAGKLSWIACTRSGLPCDKLGNKYRSACGSCNSIRAINANSGLCLKPANSGGSGRVALSVAASAMIASVLGKGWTRRATSTSGGAVTGASGGTTVGAGCATGGVTNDAAGGATSDATCGATNTASPSAADTPLGTDPGDPSALCGTSSITARLSGAT
mmetsp:Transcript_69141/g.133490  ORF Transcript_69141/g.133490 Transcript_69141/m.133490 type:complete len:225 (+) Transcript_69141:302-976(+)